MLPNSRKQFHIYTRHGKADHTLEGSEIFTTLVPQEQGKSDHARYLECKLNVWIFKFQYLSRKKVTSVRCPVVFISGLGDQLVPPSMMLDLYTQCSSERKLLLQIPNGDHNDTWTKPQYFSQMLRYVDDVCSDCLLQQHLHLSVHTV